MIKPKVTKKVGRWYQESQRNILLKHPFPPSLVHLALSQAHQKPCCSIPETINLNHSEKYKLLKRQPWGNTSTFTYNRAYKITEHIDKRKHIYVIEKQDPSHFTQQIILQHDPTRHNKQESQTQSKQTYFQTFKPIATDL